MRGSLLGWSSQDLGHPRMERTGEHKGTVGAPGPESWRLEPSSGDQFLTLLVPQASAPPAPGCKFQVLKNLLVTLFVWTSQRVTHGSSPHCREFGIIWSLRAQPTLWTGVPLHVSGFQMPPQSDPVPPEHRVRICVPLMPVEGLIHGQGSE